MTFVWSIQATADVRRIREHIVRDAPGSAAVVMARIRSAIESLEQFPYSGRPSRTPNVRELIVPRTPYIVRYRVESEVIRVMRVLHGAQRRPE
jgi:addiction module RelE/StbE family toxin